MVAITSRASKVDAASDANDTKLTCSLSGATEFAITAASGRIGVAPGAVLDFEDRTHERDY